jgi:hypothetical protein
MSQLIKYIFKFLPIALCFNFYLSANTKPASLTDFSGLRTAFYDGTSGNQYLHIGYRDVAVERPKVGFLQFGLSFLKVKDLRIELDTNWTNKSEILELFTKVASTRGIRYAVAEKIQLVITQKNGDQFQITGKKGKFTAGGNLRIWENVEFCRYGNKISVINLSIEVDHLSNSLMLITDGIKEKIYFGPIKKTKSFD